VVGHKRLSYLGEEQRMRSREVTVPPDSVLNRIKSISNGFKFAPNFDRFKRCLPVLQKFKIKYVWEEIEIGNNFLYRNISRFEMEFELKIRELL
jgi:hypothetical protein